MANSDLVVDVELKSGEKFLGCDIPQRPFGDKETYFGFYVGNDLIIVPLTEVVKIKMRDKNQV